MAAMDRSVAWRAALLQGIAIAMLAVALAVSLPHSFFGDWGWLAGPGAWAACALLAGAVLELPPLWVLLGAALSGLPSLATVLLGVHWAGTPLALLAFGAWCGWVAARRDSDSRGEPRGRDGARGRAPVGEAS
jgi:hypothetical protein